MPPKALLQLRPGRMVAPETEILCAERRLLPREAVNQCQFSGREDLPELPAVVQDALDLKQGEQTRLLQRFAGESVDVGPPPGERFEPGKQRLLGRKAIPMAARAVSFYCSPDTAAMFKGQKPSH